MIPSFVSGTFLVSLALVSITLVTQLDLTSADGDTKNEEYNKRLTQKEREEILERMEDNRKNMKLRSCGALSGKEDLPYPALPKSFVTQVEISYMDNYTVINGEESFDGLLNTGVLRYRLAEGIFSTRPTVFEQAIFYSMPADEADFIYGNNACQEEGGENCDPLKMCFTGNMVTLVDELKNFFGFHDTNPDKGFMGAASILQWGPGYGVTYRGAQDCRSMQCHKYETCVKSDDSEEMLIITYFWSSPDWSLNTNHIQVPVAVEINSVGIVQPIIVRQMALRIDFYDFLYNIGPNVDALMPPVDVFCYGRKSLLAPPRVPHYFSYKSEAIVGFDLIVPGADNQSQVVTFTATINQEEYYDWDAKISRAEFVPWFLPGEENRYEFRTYVVHDFNQGLQYAQQRHLGTCHIRLIENITSSGDVVVNPDGSVEMRPPWIFEDMDEPMQYNGVHWTRGIAADVWIGTKKIPNSHLNETIVWYYASPFMEDEDVSRTHGRRDDRKFVSMDRIPVRLEKYVSLFEAFPHAVYNIYSYEDEPPMTHEIDISPCYDDNQMISFIFDLPADSIWKVKYLRDKLRYATMTVLAEFGQVSPLRINRLVLEERRDSVRVLFTILDKPRVEGDASDADLESSMNEAATKINKALEQNHIVILVPLSNEFPAKAEPVYVTIIPMSKKLTAVDRGGKNKYTKGRDGFSSGSMFGVAIGTLIVGGLIGVAIAMVLHQRNSGSGSLPRVSMAKRSSEMPGGSVYLGGDISGGSDI